MTVIVDGMTGAIETREVDEIKKKMGAVIEERDLVRGPAQETENEANAVAEIEGMIHIKILLPYRFGYERFRRRGRIHGQK